MTTAPKEGCPLCGSHDSLLVGQRDRDGKPLRNLLCQGCGLVRVDPLPSKTDLDLWYQHAYRIDYKGVREPKPHHVLRAGRVALDRLSRIPHLLANQPRALDVGSGGGEMLYMLTHHARAQAEGLEPNEGYARHARERLGLKVTQGFLDGSAKLAGDYALITIHHVLEHLAQPLQAIALLRDLLRPGGHLVVEVPSIEATCQSPAHTYHRAHLFTWGLPTLARLGLQAGLTPVSRYTSEDGGNIEVVFQRRDAQRASAADLAACTQGYAQRVGAVLQGHTWWRHHASLQPLARSLARLSRQAQERQRVQGMRDPREILDSLLPQRSDDTQAPSARQAA